MRSSSVYIIGLGWSIQCVSTSGTVTHAEEPSRQGMDKESYILFQYRHSHEKPCHELYHRATSVYKPLLPMFTSHLGYH